ncbi:hypothetical protein SUGI_0726860 [Cryptomeria japonica]|uniref:serine/threonine-protein kinase BLUS1-like n=1 Tax=Cryptomeria japonica TaxID=3369 RepID=UPI0024147DA5|nr:serine/threonine-protein kinase BLUS1-like [Cryptomeria japonica]GLJ36210.1 hypothetical protein SUGI_0726860 [Cryptomeria japonica]
MEGSNSSKSSTVQPIRRKSCLSKALKNINKKHVSFHIRSSPTHGDIVVKEDSENPAGKFPREAQEYQIVDEIGRGTNSIVYLSKCLSNGKTVAIKCLDKEKVDWNRVRFEVRALMLLSHDNILNYYSTFMSNNYIWQVMPFMGGGSLKTLMEKAYPGGLEEPIIATVLKDVLHALAYIHGEGLIHGDIKAGNIYLDSDGIVKLGDFGASIMISSSSGYDFRADMWCFGVLAIELGHGGPPLYCNHSEKMIDRVRKGSVPRLDEKRRFSLAFKDVVGMCLVDDPRERPTASLLLKHRFFEKHAQTPQYIVANLLDKLVPLEQQIKKTRGEMCCQVLEAIGKLATARSSFSGCVSNNRLSL